MQTNWIVKKCIFDNCINHVEKSDIYFLLQRRLLHFIIWFYQHFKKKFENSSKILNEIEWI